MYLSKLVLDTRDRGVRRDLGDCRERHRTLLRAFPDDGIGDVAGGEGARARFGLLYRLERDPRTGAVAVLAQSTAAPQWARLPAGYTLAGDPKAVAAAYAAIRPGMRLRFRLRANPTRRLWKARDEKEQQRWVGRRVDVRGEEARTAWLAGKGERGGFRPLAVRAREDGPAVPNVRTAAEDRVTGRRLDADGERCMTFGSVLFEGELEVTDAEAFGRTLRAGIGSGKAYGFGLLSVARAMKA